MTVKVENQMTIAQLVSKLSQYDPNKLVMFEYDGRYPSYLCSYRGYYEDLAVCTKETATTVGQFIDMLNDINGKCLTGWKGGEYYMEDDTAVWVSQEGTCSSQAVAYVDVVEYNGGENIMIYSVQDRY